RVSRLELSPASLSRSRWSDRGGAWFGPGSGCCWAKAHVHTRTIRTGTTRRIATFYRAHRIYVEPKNIAAGGLLVQRPVSVTLRLMFAEIRNPANPARRATGLDIRIYCSSGYTVRPHKKPAGRGKQCQVFPQLLHVPKLLRSAFFRRSMHSTSQKQSAAPSSWTSSPPLARDTQPRRQWRASAVLPS